MVLNGTTGILTMVFNDQLSGLSNIKGTISIETSISVDENTNPTGEVTFYGTEFKFIFNFARATNGGDQVGKGYIGYERDSSTNNVKRIDWYIDVNTNLQPNEGAGVVTDLLSQDNLIHEIVPGSIEIFALDIDLTSSSSVVGAGATPVGPALVTGGNDANGIEITYEALDGHPNQSMTITFEEGLLNRKAYRIYYSTTPRPGNELVNGYFFNTASMGGSESEAFMQNIPINLSHDTSGYLRESSSTAGPTIDWTIRANRFGTAIDTTSDLVITDTLGQGQELRADHGIMVLREEVVYPITGSNPSYVPGSEIELVLGVDYTFSLIDNDGFELILSGDQLSYLDGTDTRYYSFIITFKSHVTENVPYGGHWENRADFGVDGGLLHKASPSPFESKVSSLVFDWRSGKRQVQYA